MTSWFNTSRNTELSTIEYIKNSIDVDWTGVTTVKSFKEVSRASLPVICINCSSVVSTPREIGGTALVDTYSFVIDIFARSDAQRLDLADSIKGYLLTCWTYYTYSHASGDNSTLEKSSAGKIYMNQIVENARVDFFEQDLSEYDRYRHRISFIARVGYV